MCEEEEGEESKQRGGREGLRRLVCVRGNSDGSWVESGRARTQAQNRAGGRAEDQSCLPLSSWVSSTGMEHSMNHS